MNIRKLAENFTQKIAVLVIVLLAIQFVAWKLEPSDVVSVSNEPFPTEKAEYRVGERIKYYVDYCKKLPVEGTIYRYVGVRLVTTELSNFDEGCRSIEQDSVTIPIDAKEGWTNIKIVSEYYINPIKTVKYTRHTQDFLVVK